MFVLSLQRKTYMVRCATVQQRQAALRLFLNLCKAQFVYHDRFKRKQNSAEPERQVPISADIWDQKSFSYTISNAEQMDRLNTFGDLCLDFKSAAQDATHLAFNGAQSRLFSVWATHSRHGFITAPKKDADLVTVRFVTRGAMARHDRAKVITAREGQAMLVRFDDMRSGHASSDFASLSAALPEQTLIEFYQAFTGEAAHGTLDFTPSVDVKTSGLRGLQQTLVAMHRQARSHYRELDLLAPMLQEIVVYQILNHWPVLQAQKKPDGHVSAQALQRALDYMEAHLDRRTTVAEIAAAAGLSVRVLQIAFKQALGCSPIQYLIDRRLDRVHEALQHAEGMSIGQIAARWGFVHPSDFSRRYNQRFGHPPSVTRAGKAVLPP